jgi:glycosyltransferase involved in cell wall biosynthesis
MPQLTLAIATRERAALLAETLDAWLGQLTPEVELLVVDGASCDATPMVVAARQATSPRLRYVRLERAGGVDRDYDQAVARAQGEYVWLLSDDDLPQPGAVQAVLDALADHPSLMVVNGRLYDSTLSQALEARRLPLEGNRVFAPADQADLLAQTGNYLSFIGGVVIRREVWLARERRRYFGSAFIHVGVIFQAPLPAHAVVLAEPWLRLRGGNASWARHYFEIWMIKWPTLIWSFTHLAPGARQAVFAREPWRRPGALLICRAKGAYGPAEFWRFLAPRGQSPAGWLLRWAIAHLPQRAVTAAAIIYFRLLRPHARADMMDFRSG